MQLKKIFKTLAILLLVQWQAQAQIDGDLNTSGVSELDAIQTPSGIWISSSMEIAPYFGYGYRVLIHRSIDNGYSWSIVDSLEMYGDYIAIGDPVMSVDNEGNPYFLIMKYLEGSDFILHLSLYVSEDEGQSWTIKSQPYLGQKFADTPHFIIDTDNTFYISYTEYNNSYVTPSFIHFIKSEDGGVSWTSPQIFESSQSFDVVGANFNFSEGGQINLAYGDYLFPATYFTSSEDAGATWSEVIDLPNTLEFAVNKVISNKNYESICVLSHRAHDPTSGIVLNYSLDNGETWSDYVLADNASMAEGYMDDDGFINITFNQFIGNEFELNYIYSTDGGLTFSAPLTLFSGPSYLDFPLPIGIQYTSGESQSMLLGNDNMIHLTFVDWTDFTKAKHLIFEPFNYVSSVETTASSDAYKLSLYPNPTSDFLNITLENPEQFDSWNINAMDGKKLLAGSLNSNKETTINIRNLESGTYLLSVQSGSVLVVRRFLKI